jgi:hypothetical protein
VNEFSASEQVAKTCPIEAQSAAIARVIASICNDERARFGNMSGRDEFIHRLSVIQFLTQPVGQRWSGWLKTHAN